MIKNAARLAAATAKAATTGGLENPAAPPSISAQARAPSAMTTVAWPPRSNLQLAAVVSGAYRQVSHSPVAPIGRLMKKMARQPSPAISRPPMIGPADKATAAPAAHHAIARPRLAWSVKAWLISASEQAPSNAAPPPWTARAAISTPIPGASPQVSDATMNTANPAANIRRAPNRSPSAPTVKIKAANISV